MSWLSGSPQHGVVPAAKEREAKQELDLWVSHLEGQFDRFAYSPPLLAGDFRQHSLLTAPHNREQQDRVNRFLSHVDAVAGKLDVYLVHARGVTVAAGSWQNELTLVGSNFRFRPYFRDAMQGRPGRYCALGTTSGHKLPGRRP